MSLVSILACAAVVSTPVAASPRLVRSSEPCAQEAAQEPARIAWFRGTYEELLVESARTKRLVFLDFFSHANAHSKKLEKGTLADCVIVAELSQMLCFAIDADGKESKPLRKRFQILNAPALVFLDPDGTLRDQITGFIAAEPFLIELRRIKANKGTFSDLRARIAKDADDLDSRWGLAQKLRAIGDIYGFEEQVSEIRERDREGRSPASRRLHLSTLYTTAAMRLDLEPLYAFVAAEKDPALLFDGWWSIWTLEGQAARSANSPEEARRRELRYFAAARELWPLVPAEQHGRLGNNIAWSFYECRTAASRSDLEFALGVAQKAVAAAPEVPAVVDTLACCLFAVGKRDEAVAQARRCIELDPQNPTWRERLAEFNKAH